MFERYFRSQGVVQSVERHRKQLDLYVRMDKLKTLSYLFDSRFLVAAITMPHNSIVVTENDIEAVNKTAAKATANFSYTSS